VTDRASAIETIERLRAMGARRIRVGDVEVEFFTSPHESPAPEKRERIPPDEQERQRKAAEEDLLFAASG
jgi:hypothetical protein